ncbi:2464_t:CDS:2 [Ambispora leptoticha]|uniref:2464_t:CDS:1 n=1 Tax=Ambispora leptoticha TaxID=144679 RepID=A0A9N9CBK4_9GLOM|nr:2464_t:CDS:2 [Ambispora leptoticha]
MVIKTNEKVAIKIIQKRDVNATGGELFDHMCDRGKFTEADAVEVIKTELTQ